MSTGITAALVVAAVLGLWFSTTRGMSIAAVAALTLLHPWLVVPILIALAAAFHRFRIRK